MRLLAAALAAVAVAVSGCGSSETETATVVTRTETVARTATEAEPALPMVLPPPVEEKRAAILAAAESGDYEALRPLLADRFSFTFGGAEGGPIAYWQMLEREGGASPIAILGDLLKLPPTLHGGVYTWPFAFDKQPEELTEYERDLLRSVGGEDLSDDFGGGSGYLGWRAGIEPDGDWIFFIAGD